MDRLAPAGQTDAAPPARIGDRWDEAEYAQLTAEIRSGCSVEEIAATHGRPRGGITSACNRLLPKELREDNRSHAPAALARYLAEHPGEHLEAPQKPAKAARKHRTRKVPIPQLPPMPEAAGGDIDEEAPQLEPGDAAALSGEAVAGLDGKPREQTILRMRLGLGEEPRTLDEIAEHFDLSRERIRQIEAKALPLLVRHARRPGTPGAALGALLQLPGPDGIDEAFVERIAELAATEFEAPARLAIPFLVCAAGVAAPTARHIAALARTAQENRRALEVQQRRTEVVERRTAAVARRAEAAVQRWLEHAAWPTAPTAAPDPGKLSALRLTEPGEAAGSFLSAKLGREVLYESSLELAALTALESSTAISWYQEQPAKIPYTSQGRHHVYYPDILAATADGRCLLIEVKPLMNMPATANRAKADAGRTWAHEHGWGWVIVDSQHTNRDLETHVIPTDRLTAISSTLNTHGHIGWKHVLELRASSRVTPRDLAAFILQTGAHFTLEPRYRITAPRSL